MSTLWIIFWIAFIVISTLDYLVTTHRKTPVGVKSSLRWTGLWVGIALSYAVAIYFLHPEGSGMSLLFLSGYLTEYSLSIDNLFVFILIFSLMKVPEPAQPKLIKLGIYLSIVLRIFFILFGITLLERFHALIYIFGALLIWTAWKMLSSDSDEQINPEKNLLFRLASKALPMRDPGPDNRKLFNFHEGKMYITPLFLVFIVIGSTDLLFAIDSIPAIMGITTDPFVVLTSNIFAVLGLNSLFFALRGVMEMFKFLKHGVSIILFFIGAKMLASALTPVEHWFQTHSFVSLLVIGIVLTVSIVLSIWHTGKFPSSTEKNPDHG